MSETAAAEIDQRLFRDVLGHYPTGVVAVTGTGAEGEPLGMVVGTFSSVSLDPPLVAFMPTRESQTYAQLREAESFCINVLAHDQQGLCRTLSQRDPDKFDRIEWEPSRYGAPQLAGSVAQIHCRRDREVEAGDHLIVLCSVHDIEITRPVTPLLFFQGGYGGFSSAGLAAYVDADLISAVRVAERARPQLGRLADRLGCSASALVLVNDHDQTIGASAYGGSTAVSERLGVRIPLVPPLGEAAVAWSESYAERWLARIFPQDAAVVDGYRERLARVRRSGFAASVVPEGREEGYAALNEALHEYALGQLTPARDRAVRGAFAASAEFFRAELPGEDESGRVASIVVPVFDSTAAPETPSGIVIRVGDLPEAATRAHIREWVAAAKQAAAEVSETLASDGRDDFERYIASGLRDRA